MKEYVLNCADIDCPATLHSRLRELLELPQWYGGNLDALYDCLTALASDTRLTLLHFEALGTMGRGLLRVLRDAAQKNPMLHIAFSEAQPEQND